jgi:hypothetical protein
MMGHDSERRSVGRITVGLEEGALVEKTAAFVLHRLQEWRDDPDRPREQSEDRLNLQLCKFLETRARSDFPMVCFYHQEPQTGRRRVDLSASPVERMRIGARQYAIYQPFLVLEGKRLPAPSADRRMEYVTGGERKDGGIQRFKLALHGAELSVAAMIGYVQAQSPSYWHQVINGWISDLAAGRVSDVCVWEAGDRLGQLSQDPAKGIADCQSVHGRSGTAVGPSIRLRHLWVAMGAARGRE